MKSNVRSNFALIGAAGFVAPRHMRAIKETGNELVAAIDKHDSVGIMDSYFPKARFFTEFERFDRHVDKLRRDDNEQAIDYISVCSPNYLHDAHIRFGLRSDADVICEKPLVLNPWNIDSLLMLERETGRRVFTILQLRLHPSINNLRAKIRENQKKQRQRKARVELTYVASRGSWYQQSWKGDSEKSGGIATNIGVHFFDLLHYLFGDKCDSKLHAYDATHASGLLLFPDAEVSWYLSIDENDLPKERRESGARAFRSLTYNGVEINFSDGFTDLHTASYREVMGGKGFNLESGRSAITTVAALRSMPLSQDKNDWHIMLSKA